MSSIYLEPQSLKSNDGTFHFIWKQANLNASCSSPSLSFILAAATQSAITPLIFPFIWQSGLLKVRDSHWCAYSKILLLWCSFFLSSSVWFGPIMPQLSHSLVSLMSWSPFSSVKLDSFNCTNLYTIFIAGKKCAPQALADRVFAIVNKLMWQQVNPSNQSTYISTLLYAETYSIRPTWTFCVNYGLKVIFSFHS